MARLLFFGKFADLAGGAEQSLALGDAATLQQLVLHLVETAPELGKALVDARVRFAINDRISSADAAICDEDEIAFFPPVSGGDHAGRTDLAAQVELAKAAFDPAAEQARFAARLDHSGAIASFVGRVRGRASDGAAVTALTLDHHPRLTLELLRAIAAAAQARWTLEDVLIVHRIGSVAAGEPIVLVIAASAHRRAAFEAVDYMMDRLKTEALLWKREEGIGAGRWIEPRGEDYADAARWAGGEGDANPDSDKAPYSDKAKHHD